MSTAMHVVIHTDAGMGRALEGCGHTPLAYPRCVMYVVYTNIEKQSNICTSHMPTRDYNSSSSSHMPRFCQTHKPRSTQQQQYRAATAAGFSNIICFFSHTDRLVPLLHCSYRTDKYSHNPCMHILHKHSSRGRWWVATACACAAALEKPHRQDTHHMHSIAHDDTSLRT